MVTKMKSIDGNNEINTVRTIFIETLSGEFLLKTGFGAYAYLAPTDINQLFKEYLHQPQTLKDFSKSCVRKHVNFF